MMRRRKDGTALNPEMRCRNCEYLLASLTNDRCPECGTFFDPDDPLTWTIDFWQRQSARVSKSAPKIFFLALLLIPVEFIASCYAYETVGEIFSGALIFLVFSGNVFVLSLLFFAPPRLVMLLMMLIALLIIPKQIQLGIRHYMLMTESEALIDWLENVKDETGKYPANLNEYSYIHPSNKRHFQRYYISPKDGGYRFFWYIGTPGTSHDYCPKDGWHYYPD